MQKRLNAIRSRSYDIRRTLRLVWRITPFWTGASLVLVTVQGLLPLAALYLMKKVVDTVDAGIRGNTVTGSVGNLVLWIALAGATALLVALCRTLSEIVNEAQSHYVTEEMTDRIHVQSTLLDLAQYEDASYHDMMQRAQQEAPHRPPY